MQTILKRVYGEKNGDLAFARINALIKKFACKTSNTKEFFSQDDLFLITYGDSLISPGETPLFTFHQFANRYFKDLFSTIHILPFYPYSTDDGFSVKDFFAVNPELGSWQEIKSLSNDFRLMFDLVLNHFSSESEWFNKFLTHEEGYQDFAIEVNPATDLSSVTRPRSLPLLTEFRKKSGEQVHLWTTFSSDQIDFNFKSLNVLVTMIEILLFYVKNGASVLRMDAIAYLWKEIGTSCIHLPQTHDMVRLFRKILDIAAPDVIILTETNVPHEENISYFGNGQDEAQMVYNFTLPPLLLHTITKGDATILSQWAKELDLASPANTFFNFTSSHDGIGVRPLEGILPKEEIDNLARITEENGGAVSYKQNSDGSESPYELNITYIDALLPGKDKTEEYHAQRFLASQAIPLALPGVPAIYIHSLLGSRNWQEGVQQTNRARSINREKLETRQIKDQLRNSVSFRSRIFFPYCHLIKVRRRQPAFHPKSGFEIMNINPQVFAIKRFCDTQSIQALTNISSQETTVSLPKSQAPTMTDLLSQRKFKTDCISLKPYEYIWLVANN